MRLEIVPFTLREANEFVEAFHRHNGRTARNGGKFAIGLRHGTDLVGVAIVGNPLSAKYMDGFTAEVLRTCTRPEAPLGAVSKLYAVCWRAWQALGGRKLITYTLQTESGSSLKGAGWRIVGQSKPIGDNWNKQDWRQWQPIYGQKKFRWEIAELRKAAE
jgi:hypothetical protein